MLYMPATTAAMPVYLQEGLTVPLQASTRYYMLQPAPIIPAVPVLNTTYVYPRYGFVPKPVETSVTKDEIEKSQATQLIEVAPTVQHVVHHHIRGHGHQTCPGYCELCCPWIETNHPPPQRHSRRDHYERDELDRAENSRGESLDERIERIRQELRYSPSQHRDKSMETVEHHIHHQRPRSRSSSSHRASSLPRDPWRSSNQNDYSWRDAHLPAYRDATLARSQTPVDESRTWHETAHARSHRNTERPSTSYNSRKEYVYRPKSETEARKHYTQTTGKDADREVHQALHGGTTTYKYKGGSSSSNYQPATHYDHSFYADVPTTTSTKTHVLKKIDSTYNHDLYASNHESLHVVPKQSSSLGPSLHEDSQCTRHLHSLIRHK